MPAATTSPAYACPMHPEIQRPRPASCPLCGMSLEPIEARAVDAPDPELIDMTRRFWIGLALALPVFLLEMGGHVPWLGLDRLIPPPISNGFNSC